MKLAEMTWQDVAALSRDVVVLIPTGSLEQHGPHLPLFTDSLIATAVGSAVEAGAREECLLVPTVWLGASGHHMGFAGSLTSSFEGYDQVLIQIIEGLASHGFYRFYLVNAHGGNTAPNEIVCRKMKAVHPELTIGRCGYFEFIDPKMYESVMEGRAKHIRHACEAEASLMMHLHPELVRREKLRDDGLEATPAVPGMVWHFDETTQEGSLGEATLASAEKGKVLFEAAIDGLVETVKRIHDGVVLIGEGD